MPLFSQVAMPRRKKSTLKAQEDFEVASGDHDNFAKELNFTPEKYSSKKVCAIDGVKRPFIL